MKTAGGAHRSAREGSWENWARTQRAERIRILSPESAEELAAEIRSAPRGSRFKALGAGHSFTGISAPVETAIDMSRMRGLRSVDRASGRVRVGAGTHLWELPKIPEPYGLAMENRGDIDRQTISGAISTGTHGTGLSFRGIAAQVSAVEIVTGTGDVMQISETENSELLPFVRVGLGALGVMTEVELSCVPAYCLEATEAVTPLAEIRERWDDLFGSNDHFEFHWFPGNESAATKINRRLGADATPKPRKPLAKWVGEELVSNTVFRMLCEAGRVAPQIVEPVNRIATNTFARPSFTEPSAAVYAASRRVRFREMEYAVPIEHLPEAFERVRARVAGCPEPIEFPVEVRAAASDDSALSTASGRASGYIAMHRYIRKPHEQLFRAAEEILTEYSGRPHWGKLHTKDAKYLQSVYPRFDEFVAVRNQLDPHRIFENPYLRRVLGA